MTFQCNICNFQNTLAPAGFKRDEPSCKGCGSSIRLRALMHALSIQLFGVPVALADFPVLKSIRGLGLSDERASAALLAAKFDYRNTFYHQEPHLDLTKPPSNESGIYDFILAGEIFEHVPPPVQNALDGISALLKPSGFLAMTVPYSTDTTTREHFPEMQDYKLVSVGDRLALVNRTQAGKWQVFEDVVFHGGDGSTLEVRLFSESDLRENLSAAGFKNIRYITDDYAEFGILHEGSWGVPVVAERGAFRMPRESIAEMMEQHLLQTTLQEGKLQRSESECLRLEALCRELKTHLDQVDADLEKRSRWALSLNEELDQTRQEIARLQAHEQELQSWAQAEVEQTQQTRLEVKRLQLESDERTQWALQLEAERKQQTQDIGRLATENDRLRRLVGAWEASRWSHLGRVLGLGPKIS